MMCVGEGKAIMSIFFDKAGCVNRLQSLALNCVLFAVEEIEVAVDACYLKEVLDIGIDIQYVHDYVTAFIGL